MKRRLTFLFILGALALGGGGSAWHFRSEMRRDSRTAATLASYTRTLDERRAAAHNRRLKAEAKHDGLEATLAAATAQSEPPKPAPPKPGWLELLQTDPKVQSLYLAYQRSGVVTEFGPLFHELGLDPDRIARFTDNFIRHRGDQSDLETIMVAKQLSEDDPAVQELRGRQQSEYEDAQRAVIGADGVAKLQTYEQEIDGRMMVNGIAGEAIMAGTPLSAEQLTQLNALVVKATQENRTGGSNDLTDWERIDREARAFLTPAQLQLITSAEALGPMGYGWRFQDRLNDLITAGDREDQAKKQSRHP